MSGAMNKRQQARNERTLHELLKLKGNDRCADCATRNPGWASWNLGIFLCVRCASLHRKMGTHISKVKSMSMDTWTIDQVEYMKKGGNTSTNARYNPRNQKPNIPIDSDEVDGAMERFIREKYQHRTLSGEGRPLPSIKHYTGSSSSSSDVPPPLPPKPNPRLASELRSQSATFSTSQAPLPSPPTSDWSSGGSRNGESRRMGGISETTSTSRPRSFDMKLDQLRDMGFANDSKNSTILKGVSGDINRAVDALNRLGEGYGNVLPRTRPVATTNGISFERPRPTNNETSTPYFSPQQTGHSQASAISNPYFRQQRSQSTQPQATEMPTSYSAQNAPETQQQDHPPHSAPSYVDSFQNMQVSQPSQPQPPIQSGVNPKPLFPHNTGSWIQNQPQMQNNPFLKTWTPPMTPSPHQFTSNPIPTHPESNQFLRYAQLQALAAANQYGQHAQQYQSQSQPQYPQPTGMAHRSASMPLQSPPQNQYQQQAQDFFQIQPQPQQQQPLAQSAGLIESFPQSNVYLQQPQQQSSNSGQNYINGTSQPSRQSCENQPQQPWQQQQWQQSQLALHSPPLVSPMTSGPPQPQYRDKTSILALYHNSTPQPQAMPPQHPSAPEPQSQQQQMNSLVPQRSITMPVSTNPFAPPPPGHVSRESVLFTGQHIPGRSASPDAFAGLSARWG